MGNNNPMTKIDFTEHSWLHVGKENGSTTTQKIMVSSQPAGHCQNDFHPWENENKHEKMEDGWLRRNQMRALREEIGCLRVSE